MQVRQFSPRSLRSLFKWGSPSVHYDIKDRVRSFLRERVGVTEGEMREPHLPGLADLPDLPAPQLPASLLAELRAIVGGDNVDTDGYLRVRQATGATYLDAMQLRLGQVDGAPDVVVAPRNEAEVQQVLERCSAAKVACIPAGGRTSVTRALRFERGGVSLDLTKHLNCVLEVNRDNLTCRVQPGILGPDYEEYLNERGYTCGHFPQSFEFATPGGWVAAKGAGQQSTYFGKAEDMLVALRCATPRGLLATRDFPRASIGPDLNAVIAGSEGTFGVITELTLRIWPHRPRARVPFAFMFRNFGDGARCLRALLHGGFGRPGVCRLSDGEETDVAFQLDGLAGTGIDRWLQRLGYAPGERSVLLAASEGDGAAGVALAARAHALALRNGGLPLGTKPFRSWWKRRFHDPYLRDDLMDMGVLVDTLETSVPWSGLEHLRETVRAVIKARPQSVALCHISHAYDNGANLYFIFLTKMVRGEELSDYKAFHGAIVDAIVAGGGSLSHHHGVGRLFADRYPEQIGELAHGLLGAIKGYLDPEGIMNPGALGL